MSSKYMYIYMCIVIVYDTLLIVSDNENGRVVRDPVKMKRLVQFRIDLNHTLHVLKETTKNNTFINALNNVLR